MIGKCEIIDSTPMKSYNYVFRLLTASLMKPRVLNWLWLGPCASGVEGPIGITLSKNNYILYLYYNIYIHNNARHLGSEMQY